MKNVTSLSDIDYFIKNEEVDFYHIVQGIPYRLDKINLLNMKLFDIITLINQKQLKYKM